MRSWTNIIGLVAISLAENPISKIICLPSVEKGTLKLLNFGKFLKQYLIFI